MSRSQQRKHSCMRTALGRPRTLGVIKSQARRLGVSPKGTRAEICNRITRKQRRLSRRRTRSRARRPPCAAGKIRNLETNRCVKKSGAIGKRLSKRRTTSRVRRPPCAAGKVRNPETNRCVKKSGAIGKRLSKRRSRSKTRKPSRKRELVSRQRVASTKKALKYSDRLLSGKELLKFRKKFGTEIEKRLKKDGFYIARKIGSGVSGDVYLVCKLLEETFYCEQVIKIQKYMPRYVEMEKTMQEEFHKVGLAPQLYDTFRYKNGRTNWIVFRMGKVSTILTSILGSYVRSPAELKGITENLKSMIRRMDETELTHGDMHYDNIALDFNENLQHSYQFIDFGWSQSLEASPELEILKILQVTPLFVQAGDVKPENGKYIVDAFKEFYLELFGDTPEHRKLLSSQRAIDKRYDTIHKENEKVIKKQMKLLKLE